MGFPQASGVVGGAAAAGPSFSFYRDSYGGSLDAASFSDAMPAAEAARGERASLAREGVCSTSSCAAPPVWRPMSQAIKK